MFLIAMSNYTALFRATHNNRIYTQHVTHTLHLLSTLDTPLGFTSTSTYNNCASLLLCVSVSLPCRGSVFLPPCSNSRKKGAGREDRRQTSFLL
jgi:hypothetical protein